MPQKIIFIVGPTGVGKSALGAALALKTGGEIVSADAMQVYRQVNIVCDKPSVEMRRQIMHHLLDEISVTDEYDVAQFRKAAIEAIDGIHAKAKLPIVVGGSGMYITVLLDGIFESGFRDEDYRVELLKQSPAALHKILAGHDPAAAAKIHPNDTKRLVRALEVFRVAGKPISQLQQDRSGLWGKYDITIIGLFRDRSVLYAMAEERVEKMFERGLVEEIKNLCALGLSRTAVTMIGVPEVRGYLNGEYDLERARYLLKRNTRHYIKRQLTWFRRDKRIQWVDAGAKAIPEIVDGVLECRDRGRASS